jgi:hypothetical protein
MRRRWLTILAAVGIVVAYGALLFFVRGWQLGLVDSAIGDLRGLLGAQAAYAQASGGFNEGDLTQLSTPYGVSLAAVWSRPGRVFTPGPPAADHAPAQRGVLKSSVRGFRAVADASLDSRWAKMALLSDGQAAFCTDARGYLCRLSAIPKDANVECPSSCERW